MCSKRLRLGACMSVLEAAHLGLSLLVTKDLEALDGEREMGRRPAVGLTEPQLG